MREKKDRLVIDTNLWISYLLGLNFGSLTDSIQNRLIILLFSKELLDEFLVVAVRPKFNRYFTISDLEELIYFIRYFTEMISVRAQLEIGRDPKDNFLLALAIDGSASHLLTDDRDLLSISRIGRTRILRINEYLKSA